MSVRLGIDVGGTFTDLVLLDEASGSLRTAKASSTPGDPSRGVLDVLAHAGVALDDITALVHGTTVATNALLERRGARTAFICTRGFRDIVFIQRMNRKHHYDLTWNKPRLPVARRDCLEVSERVDYKGRIVEPLDEDQARAAIGTLKERGVEAIAVCFLFAYLDPSHELRLRELIREVYPTAAVSLSHEVYPRWREYERASTTILDAFLKPLVGEYVEGLHAGLAANGVAAPLLLMKSNGGVTDYAAVARKPIDLLVSGPVGGVLASVYLGHLTGRPNLIASDMGGTSFDVSLIAGGEFHRSTGVELEWGIPIRTPMVDVKTIGAGGGSLAWIDKGGLLRVGPQSAGAKPGPACYGRGGTQPTVTDANVVLGRLSPARFAGGRLELDAAAARAAVGALAERVGRDLQATAHDIIELVNWNMANALRLVSIDQGRDPRGFTLVSFGGAGPAHASALAEMLDIHEVLVPVHPGVLSALGLTTATMRVDVSQTANMRSDLLDVELVDTTLSDLRQRAVTTIAAEGFTTAPSLIEELEMRYLGQNYGVEVLLPRAGGRVDPLVMATLFERFADQHTALYGYSLPGEVIELVNFNVTAVGPTAPPSLPRSAARPPARPREYRAVFFVEGGGQLDTPVFSRHELAAGQALEGPAVVEEDFSTTVLLPGQLLTVDAWGNLVIRTRKGRSNGAH